jgi:hypothetical protein
MRGTYIRSDVAVTMEENEDGHVYIGSIFCAL